MISALNCLIFLAPVLLNQKKLINLPNKFINQNFIFKEESLITDIQYLSSERWRIYELFKLTEIK